MASLARQNYHQDCEAAVNKQINLELHVSYVYLSIGYYFDRDDVALSGFQEFYIRSSDRERKRAEKWMKFQNSRGGRIVFQDIQKPQSDEWSGAAEALQVSLDLEKTLNKSLLDLHVIAEKHGDKHMTSFIEDEYLHDQVKIIKRLCDMIANVKRVGVGLGVYVFDQKLRDRLSTAVSATSTDNSEACSQDNDKQSFGVRCPMSVN